jgi:hypothetical protein
VDVRKAGSGSWRLEVSDSDLADIALFVRDAVALVPPSTGAAPPPLAGTVPDRRAALADGDRDDAAGQWSLWWQRIMEFEFGVRRSHAEPAQTTPGAVRGVLADARAISDPPDFTVLEDSRQLRTAVLASYDDAARWLRSRSPRSEAAMDWAVIKQAVEDVAYDRRVPVHTLDGELVMLPVADVWWQRIGPGQALCSVATARNAQAAYTMLYDVFASSIDR